MAKHRDMTVAEFGRALVRNGFARDFLGLWFRDTTGVCRPGLSFGALLDPRTRKIDRRGTIAYLLRQRRREIARAAEAAPTPVGESLSRNGSSAP